MSEQHPLLTARVWLVDDQTRYRELIGRILVQAGGFEITGQFGSAEEAIAALSKFEAPDHLLLDVCLPGMNGAEAVRFFKQISPATNVVMLTTFYDADRAAEARAGGASAFLRKCDGIAALIVHLRLYGSSAASSKQQMVGHPHLSGIMFRST